MFNKEELIEKCKKADPEAQKFLYFNYGPTLKGVCLRYAVNKYEADDIFQDAFIKIFTRIKGYSGEGSFEGWMRRVVVNTAIDHYKKNKKIMSVEVGYEHINEDSNEVIYEHIIDNLSSEELLGIIEKFPPGYRMVFNLYIVEGYTHKEIADMLNISEGTSKSQLFKAKKMLTEILSHHNIYKNENYARQSGR